MKTILSCATFFFLFNTVLGQTPKDVSIDYMLRGRIYAQSSIEDTVSAGGFADSENAPKKIGIETNFAEEGFFLKIDTTKKVTIHQKFNGYEFFIVNKSDTLAKLEASDSRLYVIAEVLYKGNWEPIEYLPSSWCGNSYHDVYLKPNEYWTFTVPKFSGTISTKLRYRLMVNNLSIYSNEIETSINKGQLQEKEGHKSNGIMDPYDE